MDRGRHLPASAKHKGPITMLSQTQLKADSPTQPSGMYTCLSCDRYFLNREHCREHMRDHARNCSLKCRSCDEPQKDIRQLLNHLRSHGEEFLKCFICGFRGSGKDEMEQHLNIHTRLYQPYYQPNKQQIMEQCKECDFQTLDKNKMIIHRFKEHIKLMCVVPPGKNSDEAWCNKVCTECGETFISMATLNKHKKMHNSGKHLYSCPYCEYRSDFPRAIEKHLKKKHKNLQMVYKCAICSYFSVKLSALKTHVTLNRHRNT